MSRTISKPPGIPVFPPHGDPRGDCVLSRLLAEEPDRDAIAWPEGFGGGIAHRLDTSTSGALWIADDPAELAWMRSLFEARRLVKTYRLVAARDVPWDTNRCTAPIAHDRRRRTRMIVQRGASTPHRGRWHEAETRFRRLHDRLFEAEMRTGVMHQIRVHAAFVGIPLVGDRLYGGGAREDGEGFLLHHVGLVGSDGVGTDEVELPDWAR